MYDAEGRMIKICNIPNPNLLIWGKSGQGKTYFCCRKIEEAIKSGKKVLIIDYSGSYTRQEMTKNQYRFMTETRFINVYEGSFVWRPPYEEEDTMIANLSDTLMDILHVQGFHEKKWLRKTLRILIKEEGSFNLPAYEKTLQAVYTSEKNAKADREDLKYIRHLLDRITVFDTIEKFSFKRRIEPQADTCPVSIIQLSDFPEQEKQFLSELIISSFWKETLHGIKRSDVLVLDECQFLLAMNGATLLTMLRECRKYDIELILGTQFISQYDKNVISCLLQAGNLLIFKPTAQDMRFSANIIDKENVKQWQKILGDLNIGEAVFKGTFTLNDGNRKMSTPIIVHA